MTFVRRGDVPVKIETSLLAGLLLIGTSLLARITVQGIEQALVAMVIEYGLSSVAAGRKFIANVVNGEVR